MSESHKKGSNKQHPPATDQSPAYYKEKPLKRMGNHQPAVRPLLLAALVLLLALGLAACGSSGSSSSSQAPSTTESEGPKAGAEGETEEAAATTEGVPTMSELAEGTEEEPPSSGPPVKEGISIGFVSCGQESPGCSMVPAAMEEAVKKLGWKMRIYDGRFNVNNGFTNAFHEALASNPDVIAVVGINCSDIPQPLREAKSAGVPVLGLEAVDCDEQSNGGGESLYTIPFIYTKEATNTTKYFEQWGERMGAYLVNATNGEAKALMIKYEAPLGELVAKGQQAMLEKCEKCEILAELPSNGSEYVPNGPVLGKFETLLARYPDANGVLPPFDTPMTVAGLSKAIVDAGRGKSMVAVGAEGTKEAIQLIAEERGLNAATAAADLNWLGWAGVDEINRFLNEEPAAPQGTGFALLDKENNLPPVGSEYETEIPYKQVYEKSWGLK